MHASTRTRDSLTARQRSRLMARVRSRGNRSTEGALADAFRSAGITGWRRHVRLRVKDSRTCTQAASAVRFKSCYTYPDFVFSRHRLAVYVDGCFWHACPRHSSVPTHNSRFWCTKLASNRARDARVSAALRRAGWTVIRIWEHSVKGQPATCARRVHRAIATS
jgi:DNA mismatch endonuclease (patch repair protein)